jgi:hypothetical protein
VAFLISAVTLPGVDEQAEQIADWLEQAMGRPVAIERVEPGDERVLPDREQRELDAVPSRLDERHAD